MEQLPDNFFFVHNLFVFNDYAKLINISLLSKFSAIFFSEKRKTIQNHPKFNKILLSEALAEVPAYPLPVFIPYVLKRPLVEGVPHRMVIDPHLAEMLHVGEADCQGHLHHCLHAKRTLVDRVPLRLQCFADPLRAESALGFLQQTIPLLRHSLLQTLTDLFGHIPYLHIGICLHMVKSA